MKPFLVFLTLTAAGLILGGCYSDQITKADEPAMQQTTAVRQRAPLPLNERKKVAVLTFDDRTDYGQGRLGRGAANILITYLAQSGQFSIYEREKLDQVLREQRIAAAGQSDPAIAAKIGKLIGVDYVFIGAVTGYGYHTRRTDVLFLGSQVVQEAEATVDVRLVDVATGRILDSETGRGVVTIKSSQVLGVGTSAGYDETTASDALRAAISKYVDKLIDRGISNS